MDGQNQGGAVTPEALRSGLDERKIGRHSADSIRSRRTNRYRRRQRLKKAVRAFCRACMGDQSVVIEDCPASGERNEHRNEETAKCPLWQYRRGPRCKAEGVDLIAVVRSYCRTCVEGLAEVENCTCPKCVLYPYRLGDYPEADR